MKKLILFPILFLFLIGFTLAEPLLEQANTIHVNVSKPIKVSQKSPQLVLEASISDEPGFVQTENNSVQQVENIINSIENTQNLTKEQKEEIKEAIKGESIPEFSLREIIKLILELILKLIGVHIR